MRLRMEQRGAQKLEVVYPHAELYLILISRALHILMRRLFKQDFSRVDDTGKMMEPSQVQRKHKCCPQILRYSGVVGAPFSFAFHAYRGRCHRRKHRLSYKELEAREFFTSCSGRRHQRKSWGDGTSGLWT